MHDNEIYSSKGYSTLHCRALTHTSQALTDRQIKVHEVIG